MFIFTMLTATSSVLCLSLCLLALIHCSPYEDGKYKPKKYDIHDDGKYYRPSNEGKYIPGDEGRYIYVYQQGLYPTDTGDYRYIHQTGPNGGYGGNGGQGGEGGNGGNGGEGGFGGEGGNGAGGGTGTDGLPGIHKIDYIGHRIYAERYPYIHKVIKALVDKYVSTSSLFGEPTVNHYNKAFAENEVSVKCKYLMPEKANETEFVTQYPIHMELEDGEQLESFYSFKGTKLLNEVKSISFKHKLKAKYEVYIRVVEDVIENV